MVEARWGRRLGPAALALVGALGIGSTTLGAPGRETGPPPDCPANPVTAAGPSTGAPWFRLEPTLVDGARRGQRLDIGRGRAPAWTRDLDPESFASGPVGGRVVVGTDDGRRSTVSVVDTEAGCSTPIATSTDVIRHATVVPGGSALYEFRVGRVDRADLGVWRRVPGGREAERVLPPLEPDAAFGRTWLTELGWSTDGRRLWVSSCAEVACRVRILDLDDGSVRTIADPLIGSVVGLVDDALVVRGACRGLPCPVLRIDLATGRPAVLDATAGAAELRRDVGGRPVVVLDRIDGSSAPRVIPAAEGDVTTTVVGPASRVLGSRPEFGVELPPGWFTVADPTGPLTRRFDDPTLRRLEEVAP